jgi:crossover junction endodeoxyribonuclease RusA
MIELVLPYPPSVNKMWRSVGRRVLLSDQGRKFRELVRDILKGRDIHPMTGPLEIDIVAQPPDKAKRDLDNILKALFDAMMTDRKSGCGCYRDDSQIAKLTVERGSTTPCGRIWLRITRYQRNNDPQTLSKCLRRSRLYGFEDS